MAEISAAVVKALREETGQGMMECKKALTEAGGDADKAKDILRKKGLVTAEKKADRVTKEGTIVIKVSDDRREAAMVEIQCETDFCARNDEFQKMAQKLAEMAMKSPAGKIEATDAMKALVTETLSKIRENMSFARGVKVSAGKVGTYLHHNRKVGVVIAANGEVTDEILSDVCMHIAFADPMGISVNDIPADIVEKEKAFAVEQAMASGKPKDIAEKMVTGKMRKFLEERALLEQLISREDKYGKKKVKDVLGKATITAFARYAVGSGS